MSEVPDLRSLLAEASRPSASVTVPLKQGLRERIEAAEAELEQIAADAKPKRMGAESPLKVKAREVQALRDEMASSALTFHFESPDDDAVETVRKEMGGRDDEEERDYRFTAATCVRVVGADGTEYPDRLTWQDFRDLRKRIGEPVYLATIKDASDRVFQRQWSVPFSPNASHILGTET